MHHLTQFITRFALLALVACVCTGAAQAQAQSPDIAISNAWARPTVEGQQGGGGFVTLINHGKSDDRLIGASSPAAGHMELHTMKIENNVMRMRQVPNIEIKAGETVELKPGGLHVMFMDLKQPLITGSKAPVTLQFEKAGTVTIEFTIQPRPSNAMIKTSEAAQAMDHEHMHGIH